MKELAILPGSAATLAASTFPVNAARPAGRVNQSAVQRVDDRENQSRLPAKPAGLAGLVPANTFPLDVVAAWTDDRRTLTVAVVNPGQTLKLGITGAALSGKGTLWRLASTEANGRNPSISSLPVDSVPDSVTLPRLSVNIYELSANQAPKQ